MTEYADRIPAPRPVPTTRHRLTDARTCDALCRDIEVERDDLRIHTGRLEADNRAMMRDRDQALVELERARNQRDAAWKANDRHRQELGAAGEVLAVVRDAVERIDRALATYDTTPGETDCPTCRDTGLAVVGQQFNGRPVHANCPECGIGAEREDTPHEDPARLREQLAEAHADCARYATERDEARGELERLSNANDTLALTLAEAIGALTPDGGGCSRGWIPGPTVDRWRRALQEAEEARTPALGSLPPRAQDEPADAHLGDPAGYEIVATRLYRDRRGQLVSGNVVVASAVSTRPTLAEAVDELRRAIGPAEREG